jgi:hypothetical protein
MLAWFDSHPKDWRVRLVNQLFPVVVCLSLLAFFIWASMWFITNWINPYSAEQISLRVQPVDAAVGFFLYFVTAVDYALIIGRMQNSNPGLQARFVMNVCTCVGCFVGVSLVLFVWGFAKEVDWLIIALMIFAGSVMVKLAHEGLEYFEDAKSIPWIFRSITAKLVTTLYTLTDSLTFWIPELASPNVKRVPIGQLAMWSFLLPFIIGLDDFVGYMGAMTIYNVFSLLVGIYMADILIDILIFISPATTKKVVQSAVLSLVATYAFLYLMYKSYSEAVMLMLHTHNHNVQAVYLALAVCFGVFVIGKLVHQRLSLHIRRRV